MLIKAEKGKVFRRIADGTVYGDEIDLGYTYCIGGEVLDEPHLDVPEDFEQIPNEESEKEETG